MNLGGHIGAGWLLAHAARLNRFERRWVVVMAMLADVDAVFLLWKGSMDSWHRTFGHNVWMWLAAPLVVPFCVASGRRLLLLGLCYLAMASHVALDLIATGWWGLYPFWPLAQTEILMSLYFPENLMKWGIQPALLVAFIASMIWIYVRHGRTPLEVLSPAVDSLLVNFVVLPWRHRCHECGHVALYRCSRCARPLCPLHRALNWRLQVFCSLPCSPAEPAEHSSNSLV